MKKFICLIVLALTTSIAFAQVQQGRVKTRGRLTSDGKVITGQDIPDATITLGDGSTFKSGSDGRFSFAVTRGNYYLKNVQKKDYQLCDRDLLARTKTYSANVLEIAMQTPDEALEDRLESEEKIRATLNKQLVKQKTELKRLKEELKISQQEYNKKLQELYAAQSNNEKLISEMAERYSTIDFDQMDDFQRRVATFIQNGELTRADSLLKTKGSMEERSAELDRVHAANTEVRETLEKSEEMETKLLEDFASDCYNYYEICKMQHKNDSAAYWLELRASKDTLNIKWQRDAADFFSRYVVDLQKSYHYDSICSSLIARQYDRKHIEYVRQLTRMASYESTYDIQINIYCEALALCDSIDSDGRYLKAAILNNLGNVYSEISNFEKAKLFLEESYRLYIEIYGERGRSAAATLGLIGVIDLQMNNNSEAMQKFEKATEMIDSNSLDENDIEVLASLYGKIGQVFIQKGEPEKALTFVERGIELMLKIYPEDHPRIGQLYNIKGSAYFYLNEIDKAIVFTEKSVESGTINISINNLGVLYKMKGDKDKAFSYYQQAVDFFSNFNATSLNAALANYNMGIYYYEENKLKEAIPCFSNSLSIYALYDDVYDSYVNNGSYCLYECLHLNRKSYMKEFEEFIDNTIFIATVISDDSPSAKKGMKGEYTLLSCGDWDANSTIYLRDEIQRLKDSPKSVLVMKDGLIENFDFDASMGLGLSPRYVGREKKLLMNEKFYNYMYKLNGVSYGEKLARTYVDLMLLYADSEKSGYYDDYLSKSLDLFSTLFSLDRNYRDEVIELKNRTIWRMLIKGDIDEALTMSKETYSMDESNEMSKYYLAQCYNSKAYKYANVSDFAKANKCVDKAISIVPIEANFYDSKGEILLMQGKNEEALTMWEKVLELNPNFLDDYHDGTNLSNGLKKLGLIE